MRQGDLKCVGRAVGPYGPKTAHSVLRKSMDPYTALAAVRKSLDPFASARFRVSGHLSLLARAFAQRTSDHAHLHSRRKPPRRAHTEPEVFHIGRAVVA
jgi:hypothetical protein